MLTRFTSSALPFPTIQQIVAFGQFTNQFDMLWRLQLNGGICIR